MVQILGFWGGWRGMMAAATVEVGGGDEREEEGDGSWSSNN